MRTSSAPSGHHPKGAGARSVLLTRTRMAPAGSPFSSAALERTRAAALISLSAWVRPDSSWRSRASSRYRTKRAAAALDQALRMPSASMSSVVSRSPAVSMKRNRIPSRVKVSSRVSRVVPGVSDTMARSSLTFRDWVHPKWPRVRLLRWPGRY
jgi:hypothetical protein